MLVGSQAGQGPNDIAGLFFLMAAIAFLVDGAASAHRLARRREGSPSAGPLKAGAAREAEEEDAGVVEECPSRATRAFSRPSAPDRCSWRGSRRGSGSAPRSPCWRRSVPSPSASPSSAAGATGCRRSASGSAAMVITTRLLVRPEHRLRPQPVPADRQARPDQPARPGPARALPAAAPQADRVLQRPDRLDPQAHAGPARAPRAALAGDPRRW